MERTLASIQRVLALTPIEGADRIELATINGWQCVVKKGDFKVGDLGVYLEIDSIPPDVPAFQFLWQKDDVNRPRPAKFRIKTIRLRGVLSQGLFMPLDNSLNSSSWTEDTDVTELLGVTKYEPVLPAAGQGEQEGSFPGCIPKTDEVRIQSKPKVLDELRGKPWYATLKIDGTSCTFGFDTRNNENFVASRNWKIRFGDNKYWNAVGHLLDDVAGLGLIVQGEIAGPGIQGNPLNLSAPQFFMFSAFDPYNGRYLTRAEEDILALSLGIWQVPVVYAGDAFDHTLDELLLMAEGKYPGTNNEREGLVIRERDGVESRVLQGRLSFKVISNKFLLAEKD